MSPRQFSLRQLLVGVTLFCLLVVVLKWLTEWWPLGGPVLLLTCVLFVFIMWIGIKYQPVDNGKSDKMNLPMRIFFLGAMAIAAGALSLMVSVVVCVLFFVVWAMLCVSFISGS